VRRQAAYSFLVIQLPVFYTAKKLITVIKTAAKCTMKFRDTGATCHISLVSEMPSSVVYVFLRIRQTTFHWLVMCYKPANCLRPAPHKSTPRHSSYPRSPLILFSQPRLALPSSLYVARVLPKPCMLYALHPTHHLPSIVHRPRFTHPNYIWCGQYTVYSIQYTVYCILYTVQSYCWYEIFCLLLPHSLTITKTAANYDKKGTS